MAARLDYNTAKLKLDAARVVCIVVIVIVGIVVNAIVFLEAETKANTWQQVVALTTTMACRRSYVDYAMQVNANVDDHAIVAVNANYDVNATVYAKTTDYYEISFHALARVPPPVSSSSTNVAVQQLKLLLPLLLLLVLLLQQRAANR